MGDGGRKPKDWELRNYLDIALKLSRNDVKSFAILAWACYQAKPLQVKLSALQS